MIKYCVLDFPAKSEYTCPIGRQIACQQLLPGKEPGKKGKCCMAEEIKVAMTTSEAGRKGGSAVRDKYGEDYYRRIGKLGGTALKDKRGSDYYRAIAKKGGRANVDKYGPDHFSQMGKKGGNATKSSQDTEFYSRIGKLGGAAKRRKKSV
jgi:uncharacterized protein